MLIIEGTDLAGKTTLAHTLVKMLNELGHGHVYQHLSRPSEAFDRYHGYCDLAGRWQVRDRFHMSELAYCDARIKCGSPERWLIDAEQYRMVDGMLRQYGAYTVVLTVDYNELVERLAASGDDMYDIDIITAANDAFIAIMLGEFAELSGLRIDVDCDFHLTGENPYVSDEQAEQIIKNYLNRQQAVEQLLLS